MGHIFISYTHADADFAGNLMGRLRQAGFDPWVDEDIEAGAPWREGIDQAIKTAVAVIVVMSPEAKASEYVTYEWAFAWGAGLPVIPVLFRKTDLHPRLEALQYLDFTQQIRPWDALIKRLQKAVADDGDQSASEHDQQSVTALIDAPGYIIRAKDALDDDDPEIRDDAINRLAQSSSAAAREVLAYGAAHHLYDVRVQAALVLARNFGDLRAVSGLIEGLTASVSGAWDDSQTYEQAGQALAKLRQSAPSDLTDALEKPDVVVRIVAAVRKLINNLRVRDAGTRTAAVYGLVAIGQAKQSVKEEIVSALSDELKKGPNHLTITSIRRVIKQLSPESLDVMEAMNPQERRNEQVS